MALLLDLAQQVGLACGGGVRLDLLLAQRSVSLSVRLCASFSNGRPALGVSVAIRVAVRVAIVFILEMMSGDDAEICVRDGPKRAPDPGE